MLCVSDINECGSGNPCGNGNCSNSDGGYTCKCERGFQLNETETSCIGMLKRKKFIAN